VLAVSALMNWAEPGAFDLLEGSLLYLIGSILVTMICNVPLNDRLAAVKPESAEGKTMWTHYLSVWTAWNHVRTVASLAAMACFILAFARQWS
jgi:uncharacterized membrane protein